VRKLCVAVLMGVVLCAAARAGEEAKAYTSANGGYSVTPPANAGEPSVQKREADSPLGKIPFETVIWDLKTTAYFSTHNEYPAAFWEKADQKEALNGVVNGVVGDGKASVNEDVEFDGHPAKVVTFEKALNAEKTMHGRILVVLAKPRLYQVMVLSEDKAVLTSPECEAFLKSLKLPK